MHAILFTYRKLCFLLLLLFVQTGLNLSVQAQSKPRNLVQNGSFEEFPDSHPYKTKPKEWFDVDTNLDYSKTRNNKFGMWYQFQIDSCYHWSSCMSYRASESVNGNCCIEHNPKNPFMDVSYNNPGFFFNYYTLKNDFSIKANWKSSPPVNDGWYTFPHHYTLDLYTYRHYRYIDFDYPLKYSLPKDTLNGKYMAFIVLEPFADRASINAYKTIRDYPWNYYGYIANELRQNLTVGKKYKIGFFVGVNNWIDTFNLPKVPLRFGDYSTLSTSNLFERLGNMESIITYGPVEQAGNYTTYLTDGLGIFLSTPDIACVHKGTGEARIKGSAWGKYSPQFRIPRPHMSKGEWVEYSWEFVADKPYTKLTIGNFWDTSQQTMVRWLFDFMDDDLVRNYLYKIDPTAIRPPRIDYLYKFMHVFIDSVYLYEIGGYLPEDTIACYGSQLEFEENLGREVTWIREDGSSEQSRTFQMTVTKPKEMIVGIIDGEYDTMYVYGKFAPQYELQHTDSLCAPAGRPFNKLLAIANEPKVHYSWNQNGHVQDSSVFVSADTGVVTLTLTDSIGCEYVHQLPLEEYCPCVILPSDTMICKGASLSISDYYGRAIDWAIDGVNQGNSISLTVKPNKWQTTITGSCDSFSQTMEIFMKEPPQVILTHTDSMCIWTGKLYNKLNLRSEESISGVWDFNGASYTGLYFESMDTGIVYYKAIDSLGCETHGATYLGEYCPEFSDICAFPSAFSPNGDGLNDVLTINCVNIKSFRATILDRWGEVISMSSDANYVWDGTYKGQEATAGVYVFLIEYEVYLEPGKKYYYKGTLTLVR
ncbi:MAG: gliding motility-associated C-terminal domain-containing protein [Bacteroidetes bacterium]|nr:gliding motility-associated C-terminal domain-containing protein [Bacteroidota bacterium]